ncbi:HNH endonuclease family protein [Lactobacillus equicursoris]|uniref:HNH endonuclease family protein n=1 Tax=Lactobacillus equicursoris TaxID=420645 RepID=UPI003996B59B
MLEIINYLLLSKSESSRFPTDGEFVENIETRDAYNLRQQTKYYLFDRLENQDSLERVNVIEGMQEGRFTIEHIMPQTLSATWKKELGNGYQEIYDRWDNRLANLTLTAYNSSYSNKSFHEKKTAEYGFDHSGFRLNDFLKNCDQWTEKELNERNELIKQSALKLWPMPTTNFQLKISENEVFGLDEENDYANVKIVSYSFMNTPYKLTKRTWKEMYIGVVRALYELDAAPIC